MTNVVGLHGDTPQAVLQEAIDNLAEIADVVVITRLRDGNVDINGSPMPSERAVWLAEYLRHCVIQEAFG